jgi:hypothetical protein
MIGTNGVNALITTGWHYRCLRIRFQVFVLFNKTGGGRRNGITKLVEKVIKDEMEAQQESRFGDSIALNLKSGRILRHTIVPYFEIRSGRPIAEAYEV